MKIKEILKINESIDSEQLELSSNKPSNEFIDKVYNMYPRNPFNFNQVYMVFGSNDDQQIAMIELVDYPYMKNTVEIKWIQSVPNKSGVGTKAINTLQNLAKQDNISLALYPWDKGKDFKQKDLINFYKKLGFKQIAGSKEMHWKSNES